MATSNSSRLSIDPELVRNIEIVKGADSFNTGSGALGGGVNYQTLQGHDLLLPERQFGVMMKKRLQQPQPRMDKYTWVRFEQRPRGCRFAVFATSRS